MMVLSALRPDSSLPEFLSHRARESSVRRLVADLAAASLVIGIEIWLRHEAWLFVLSIAVGLGSYSLWGLVDRVRSRVDPARILTVALLDTACALFAATGIVAAAGVLLLVWARALGTWIS